MIRLGSCGCAWVRRRFAPPGAYKSAPHELEVTVSPFLVLPIGNRQIADQGYTHLGDEMLLGTGLGDLPDSPSLKYLRPLTLRTEVG
jgi:hypothetical protein